MKRASSGDYLGGYCTLPDYSDYLHVEYQFVKDVYSGSNTSNEIGLTSKFYATGTNVLTPPVAERIHVTGDNGQHDWYTNGHNYIEKWRAGRLGVTHVLATNKVVVFLPSGTVRVYDKPNFKFRFLYNVCAFSELQVFLNRDNQVYDPTPYLA